MPGRNGPTNSKPWFKKWSHEWLTGSIRFDCTPAERSVFDDLMCLANESRNRGVVQANPTTPYPHTWMAQALNIPLQFLEECLQKFAEQGRIKEDATGITILNFRYYNDDTEVRGRGRPPKHPKNQGELPLGENEGSDKYFQGKYGHIVQR